MPATALRVPLVRARLGRLDDERLGALAATGDERAFEAVYDRHHRALLGYCRHFLGSHDEAEDALQQTFLRAHRALLAHGAPDELRPWLFAIARNRCKSLVAARRPAASGDEVAEPSTEGLRSEVDERADLRALLADVAALPEDQRSALVLAELADMPHTEIAAVIGVPATKVKALVHQARSRLIAERDAREAPCERIREQLASARGGELRRGPLRRHLRMCEPCRAYRVAIAEQRADLRLVLPVVPGAGLKAAVLGGIAGGGGGSAATVGTTAAAGAGAAAAGGGGSTGLFAGGLGVKLAVGAALMGGAGGGVVAVERTVTEPPTRSSGAERAGAPATPDSARGSVPRYEGSSRPVTAAIGTQPAVETERRAGDRRAAKVRAERRDRAGTAADGGGGRADAPGQNGTSNASDRGLERSVGAPGRVKTEQGAATGRRRPAEPPRATPETPGKAVERRPQLQRPAGPAQDPPGQAAKPEPAGKPVKPATPANPATPATPANPATPAESPSAQVRANGKQPPADALP